MKKMFYMLALIVSSFLLFNIEVKADNEYVVTYPDNFLDYINDNFFTVREYAISNLDNEYPYYILIKDVVSNDYYIYCYNYSDFISKGRTWFQSSSSDAKLIVYFGNGNEPKIFYNRNITYSSDYNYLILDSNMNIFYDPYSLQINYLDKSYIVNSTSKFLTTYDIYKEVNGIGEETDTSHDSELSIIQSFYEVSISKISYLAESISSNYIYLSIFGVFILIFVFELIFRRYL